MFLELQLAALNKAKPLFTKMRYLCPGENAKWGIKPFQHGFMMTINAFILMQWDLSRPTNPSRIPPRPIIPQILTGPLSQDELERTFGEIRGLGGHNAHPSALGYLQRLAQLVKLRLLKDKSFDVISRKDQIIELQNREKENDACFSLENGQSDVDTNEMEAGGLDGIGNNVISKFNHMHDFGAVDFRVDLQKMHAFFNQSHPKDGIQGGGNLITGK